MTFFGSQEIKIDAESVETQEKHTIDVILMDCLNSALMFNETKFGKFRASVKLDHPENLNLEVNEKELITFFTLYTGFYLIIVLAAVFKLLANLGKKGNFGADRGAQSAVFKAAVGIMVAQLIGLGLETGGLQYYNFYDKEELVMELVGFMTSESAAYIMACLLIFLAQGWTAHIVRFEYFEAEMAILVFFGIIKILLIIYNCANMHNTHLHHRFDSVVLKLIEIFNLVLFGFFVKFSIESLKRPPTPSRGARKDVKGSSFRKHHLFVLFLGVMHFLVFPIIAFFSGYHPDSWVQEVIAEVGKVVSQTLPTAILAFYSSGRSEGYESVNEGNEMSRIDFAEAGITKQE